MAKAIARLLLAFALLAAAISVYGQFISTAPAKAQGSMANLFVDRTEPSSALSVFLEAASQISTRLEALEKTRAETGAWFYPELSEADVADMALLKSQALDSLDLSSIPEWNRQRVGEETALMLLEVLQLSGVTTATPLKQLNDHTWTVTGTYLQIGRITSGLNAGDAAFTAETVASIPNVYVSLISRKSPDQFNAYQFYTETPGDLIVPSWAGLVMALPDGWRVAHGSNTIWQWAVLIISLILPLGTAYLLRFFFKPGYGRIFAMSLVVALLAWVGSSKTIPIASITGVGGWFGSLLLQGILYLSAAVSVFFISEWFATKLAELSHLGRTRIEASIIRLFSRILGIVGAVTVLLYGLNTAGVPIMGIVAGLGVGGLAFALAAQSTIENLIAGVVLFLDGAVAVGDEIEAGTISGHIVEIGMRSTRLRAHDQSMISVTNSELARLTITNKSRKYG